MNNIFSNLLKKEMTRKEFLLHVGLGLLVATGITGVITALANPDLARRKVSSGFGAGPYGGAKKG